MKAKYVLLLGVAVFVISGYQIYHNYVRPHMSLDGKTPSEVCGITIQGNDKWRTLIENASLKQIQ